MTENKIKTGAGDGGPFFRFIRLFHFIRLGLSDSFYLARFIWLGALSAAPGYRDFGRAGWEGIARHVGNYGYSWSSAVSGINGRFLWFYSQVLDPSNSHHRANGLQLRCLSE
ncbi:hypothetical protein [uncultured Rikenella sp.]|uniref:hypothetical protein n=1 Tax=uncultured Rikenella sp. TaxID=368003 RepID=UPI0025E2CAAF|nr:hypothetical protein [uncultured Rikenella sp.]